MRKDLECPKCEGRKIWRVERLMLQKGQIPALGRFRATINFEVFICAACGYTEQYFTELDELAHDPVAGVHLIDNEPKSEGPYR